MIDQNNIFWPGIGNDIKTIVTCYEVCLKYRNNNTKEPFINNFIPDLPWQKLSMNLFHHNNKTYLLAIDYLSKYVDIDLLSSGLFVNLN